MKDGAVVPEPVFALSTPVEHIAELPGDPVGAVSLHPGFHRLAGELEDGEAALCERAGEGACSSADVDHCIGGIDIEQVQGGQ